MQAITMLPLLQLFERDIIEFKNIIEFGAVLEGRKGVVRLALTPDKVEEVHRSLNSYYPEFSTRLSSFILEDVSHMTNVDRFQRRIPISGQTEGKRVVFVGPGAAVDEAWDIEESECQDQATARVYGYPDCCGAAYRRIVTGDSWLDAFFEGAQQFSTFNFLNNRPSSTAYPGLGYHFDYFPCSVGCKETLKINRQNREMLSHSDLSEFVELTDEHLRAAVIICNECAWYVWLSQLEAGTWSSYPGLDPIVWKSGCKTSKLSALAICKQSGSALIDEDWYHTDAAALRIYIFDESAGNN